MADVTISQLTRGVPNNNALIPFSQGGNTLCTAPSALLINAGNIGIGTSAPQHLLHVSGSVGATSFRPFNNSDDLILITNNNLRVRYLPTGEIVHYSPSSGTIIKVEKTIMFYNGVNNPVTYPVLRQFHDANNWGAGNVKIEITSVYYSPGVYQNGVYLARYGYSGNSADIITKISGGSVVDDRLSWGPATFVGSDTGRSFYYRDLSFTTQNYVTYRLDITTPGIYYPLTTPTPSADSYYRTYIYNGNY